MIPTIDDQKRETDMLLMFINTKKHVSGFPQISILLILRRL